MKNKKDITFVFLLFNTSGFSTNQEDFNGRLLTQLLLSPFNPHVNILLIFTTFFNSPDVIGAHTFGTTLFELEKEENEENGLNWKKTPVANFGNINIGNQDTLGLIFTYVKAQYISTDYIVYSNNHSNQFGALNDNINNIRKDFIFFDAKIEFANKPAERPFSYFKYDIETKPKIDMLTYNEFSKAFSNGFMKNLYKKKPGEEAKITLLVLVSCYSATIDNIVNFSGSVKYLCVAESEIFYNFVNITKFMEYFTDKSVPGIEEKIKHLFDKIDTDYPEKPSVAELNRIKLTEFSCFKLYRDSAVSEAINSLNALIKYALASVSILKNIKEKGYQHINDIEYITRNQMEEIRTLAPKNSLDIFDFLNNISDAGNSQLSDLIAAVRTSWTNISLVKYKNNSDRLGLSCFFPQIKFRELDEKQFEYAAATYSVYSSQANEFSRKTLWPELLQAIEKIDVYEQ